MEGPHLAPKADVLLGHPDFGQGLFVDIAQTVAISTGEPTFASLSEASGVSVAALMRASSEFGSAVPFDVPAYAAQMAPSPSRVAEGSPESPDTDGNL